MSAIVLDTSAYSGAFRGVAAVQSALQAAEEVRIPAVVIGELRAGFAAGQHRRRNETLLSSFLARPSVSIVPIDAETADCYATIFSSLRSAGTPIGTNDIWVAASAMQHGLRLLTADRDFLRVPQIRVELVDGG